MKINETATLERPGKEIKINSFISLNKNITGKIGTLDDKKSPKTVYISMGFWVDIKNKEDYDGFDVDISKKFSKELKKIYKNDLYDILIKNKYFPFYNENIYVYDFPNNLNYNNKKSFVSLELNLHTLNCLKENEYPLKNKKENELFIELLKVYNIISTSDLLKGKKEFKIYKTKKQ